MLKYVEGFFLPKPSNFYVVGIRQRSNGHVGLRGCDTASLEGGGGAVAGVEGGGSFNSEESRFIPNYTGMNIAREF